MNAFCNREYDAKTNDGVDRSPDTLWKVLVLNVFKH